MVLLFFALDLRTLSPPLLAQLKQCLLELANLYAISAPTLNLKRRNLDDRIGLGYLQSSAASSSDEFKVVYYPRGRSFNLRDFHYAVNHLPSSSYSPSLPEDSASFLRHDVEISCILGDKVFDSSGGEEIEKKVILISSCLVGNMHFNTKKTLQDAADKCIYVEFVFLEQKSSQLSDISEKINKFKGEICDLENCSFNAYLPDLQVLNGLVKRWLRELKENTGILQAHFIFPGCIAGSVNRICCRLCDTINPIMDGFSPCEAHRCLGAQRDDSDGYTFEDCLLYPVKTHDMELDNTDNNSTQVGGNGLLTKASWHCWKDVRHVPSTVMFNVIERTSLASLSEGVVVGLPYYVISSVQETDAAPEESNWCQLNNRRAYTSNKFNCSLQVTAIVDKHLEAIYGLCHALYSMNQGLVCWSFCNLEIMRETAYTYYYILQPSDSGLMLLRRLAGAEEILPFPDANINYSSTTKEIDCCIQQCLLDVELRDYNPVQHNGGFHQKLNKLVEESLRPGLVSPETPATPLNSTCLLDVAVSLQPRLVNDVAALPSEDVVVLSGKDMATVTAQSCLSNQADEDDKGITSLAQEWEQLIVDGIPRIDSALAVPNVEKARRSPPAHRTLDTRTTNILERLGNPKQIKTKGNTHKIMRGLATHGNGTTENHPCIDVDATAQVSNTTSNLMKPNFQRLKRKQRWE